MILISIVIPVYKSSKSLEIIAEQVAELEKQREENFELIFINDSPGFKPTSESLEKIKEKHSNVRVFSLRKNQGQEIATLVGLSKAKGDLVITMDDDLQNPVSEIPKLIDAMHDNPEAEAVFAVQGYTQRKHSLWRNLGSYILNKIDTFFLEKPKGLDKSSFGILTRDICQVVLNNHNAMPAVASLIIKATNNIINIDVEHNTRVYGRSNYSLQKLISLSLNNILHYSSLPLKMVGYIGFAGLLFSVVFIAWTMIRYFFFGITFPGYASTVTLISFFGGLNLFSVGMVGEYLIRIIKEQQKIPLNDLIKD